MRTEVLGVGEFKAQDFSACSWFEVYVLTVKRGWVKIKVFAVNEYKAIEKAFTVTKKHLPIEAVI